MCSSYIWFCECLSVCQQLLHLIEHTTHEYVKFNYSVYYIQLLIWCSEIFMHITLLLLTLRIWKHLFFIIIIWSVIFITYLVDMIKSVFSEYNLYGEQAVHRRIIYATLWISRVDTKRPYSRINRKYFKLHIIV